MVTAKYEPETLAGIRSSLLQPGATVICGPVKAVWEVQAIRVWPTVAHILLAPKNPHSVSIHDTVLELPEPDSRWGQL